MFTFRFVLGFGMDSGPWSMISTLLPVRVGGSDLLLAGSSATGQYHVLDLGPASATLLSSQTLASPLGSFMLTDAALVTLDGQTRLYSAGRTGTQIDVQSLGLTGGLTAHAPITEAGTVPMAVSALETMHLGGQTYLATAAHDRSTLEVLRLSASDAPRLVSQQTDGPKTTLDGVSDMVSLTIGDDMFLIAASSRKSGLSSFQLAEDGSLTLVDALTPKDGLWVNGLDALAVAEVAGISYVIAGSAAAGSLSVIRVNALGVMFVTDQVLDDRTTRFDHVTRIETVSHQGRSFVVAGGGDGGISLLEVLPGGQLMHHTSLEARDGGAVFASGLTGLSVTLTNDRLDIFAAGAGGVARYEVRLDTVGPLYPGTPGNDRLTGGPADDVIFGAGGNDTLNGGAGDDLILGGPGTVMTGGPGDDIFRLGPGPQHSVITDFEQGHDRLDLGDWGRIHDISALSISPRPYGTLISFGENSLRVSQAGGGPIPVTEWTADDFIF